MLVSWQKTRDIFFLPSLKFVLAKLQSRAALNAILLAEPAGQIIGLIALQCLQSKGLDPFSIRLRQSSAAGDKIAAVVIVMVAGKSPPFCLLHRAGVCHRLAVFHGRVRFRAVPMLANSRRPM